MKINWKVRIKNPVFWTTAVPAGVAFIYTILGLFGVTPSISQNEIVEILGTVISGLTFLGVLVDPTTKGASDSDRAMTYTQPN